MNKHVFDELFETQPLDVGLHELRLAYNVVVERAGEPLMDEPVISEDGATVTLSTCVRTVQIDRDAFTLRRWDIITRELEALSMPYEGDGVSGE